MWSCTVKVTSKNIHPNMKKLCRDRYCYCCQWELVQNLHQWTLTDKWLHSLLLFSKLNRVRFIICVNGGGFQPLNPSSNCAPLCFHTSPRWLYLTVTPPHCLKWQSVTTSLPESHPSPTNGPDHSRTDMRPGRRYFTPPALHPLFQKLIFQFLDWRVDGIS